MGAIRAHSAHIRWADAETAIVRQHYPTAPWSELLTKLPRRSRSQIQNKAHGMGLVREKPPKMGDEERARRKRESMARRRGADPEAAREYARRDYHENRRERLAQMKAYQRRRFFWLRATKLDGITARDLASLWKRQRGRCALTGKRLDRTAQVDHVIPKARGGSDALDNLQWVDATANLAKRDLTQGEFIALCDSVMRWIGERIAAVEALERAESEAA